jgi:hypothetical protein
VSLFDDYRNSGFYSKVVKPTADFCVKLVNGIIAWFRKQG